MSIVPGVGTAHPAWCEKRHGERPIHERKVGVDLEVRPAGVAFGLALQQVEGAESTQVLFMTHTPEETALTKLSIVETGILRDLLSEALGLVGQR